LILRLARKLVLDRSEADDVAQEVMVVLLRSTRRGGFDASRVENVEGYLRVVVKHVAARVRARRSGLELGRDGGADEGAYVFELDLVPNPEELTEQAHDARRRLEELKSRLRPRDAVVFAMLVEDGMTIQEVASALGTTPNNVYQIRHRILVATRELWSHGKGEQ
jgi:RNA polymerase sigma factor (sigma-70 family)